jgi:hypothetical protein
LIAERDGLARKREELREKLTDARLELEALKRGRKRRST